MKNKFLVVLFCSCVTLGAFAGDVSVFDEIGFSKDGKTYFFGQYGKTDKKFIPYAEIYGVDVAKNDYISGKVFKSHEKDISKAGKTVYEELCAKHFSDMEKYSTAKTNPESVLYIREEESKAGSDLIEFTSFEDNDEKNEYKFSVKLVPTYYEASKKSSFYIDVDVTNQNGDTVKKFRAGNPSIKRPNVTDYKVVKIVRDNADRMSFVFVVEKRIEDASGVSIRYMVETVRLDTPVNE